MLAAIVAVILREALRGRREAHSLLAGVAVLLVTSALSAFADPREGELVTRMRPRGAPGVARQGDLRDVPKGDVVKTEMTVMFADIRSLTSAR